MKFPKAILAISAFVAFSIPLTTISAHAVVKPSEVNVGSFVDFNLGVPSEKDLSTTSIKLFIPSSIKSFTPIVKPGWKIEVVNSKTQEEKGEHSHTNMIPEAIIWSGGEIPAHQKDFFQFSAQTPSNESELEWKVEQTYSDGSVISWSKSSDDQPKDANGNPDFTNFGPLSKTKVINDLIVKDVSTSSNTSSNSTTLSIVALILSALSIGITLRALR